MAAVVRIIELPVPTPSSDLRIIARGIGFRSRVSVMPSGSPTERRMRQVLPRLPQGPAATPPVVLERGCEGYSRRTSGRFLTWQVRAWPSTSSLSPLVFSIHDSSRGESCLTRLTFCHAITCKQRSRLHVSRIAQRFGSQRSNPNRPPPPASWVSIRAEDRARDRMSSSHRKGNLSRISIPETCSRDA